MSGGRARPSRTGRIDGTPWTLFEAGRAPSGAGLGYFVRDDLEAGDRRVELAPRMEVGRLGDDAFRQLWETGRSLTSTERRVVDGDGAVWLAQSVGPAWAGGGVAAGAVGVRLRCISSEHPVAELNGVILADASDDGLIAMAAAAGGATPSSS